MWEARGSCIYCVKLQQRTAHRVSYAVNVLLLFALLNLAHCVLWGSSLASRLASSRQVDRVYFHIGRGNKRTPDGFQSKEDGGYGHDIPSVFMICQTLGRKKKNMKGATSSWLVFSLSLSLSLSIRSYVHRQNNPKGRDEETLHINLYAADLSVHFGDKQKHIDLHFELEFLFFSNFHTYFTICQFHW